MDVLAIAFFLWIVFVVFLVLLIFKLIELKTFPITRRVELYEYILERLHAKSPQSLTELEKDKEFSWGRDWVPSRKAYEFALVRLEELKWVSVTYFKVNEYSTAEGRYRLTKQGIEARFDVSSALKELPGFSEEFDPC